MTNQNIFLGLGSNLGGRLANLQNVLQAVSNLPETKLIQASSIYETEPVGFSEQGDFLNMAVELSTNLSPEILFKLTQKIENDLGRVRKVRWGPRVIDVDILYWGREILSSESLQIPHPEVENRRFVLQPLNEIASTFEAPPRFVPINELLEIVADKSLVRPYLSKEEYAIN